jgi:hypothetical protein
LQAIHAAGLPTSGAEVSEFYPEVPDHENAALVMTQAFALMRGLPDRRSNQIGRIKIPPRHQPLDVEATTLLQEYVELNSLALDKARSAADLTRSRYPVDYTPGPETLLPHLGNLKTLARIEEFRATLAIDSGRTSEATDASLEILKMAKTLNDDPCLISQLVRIAMIAMSEAVLERRANAAVFDKAELDKVAAALASAEKTNSIARALIGERGSYIPCFRMSWSDIKRYSNSSDGGDDGGNGNDLSYLPESDRQPGIFRVTGFFERDLLFFLQTMETNIALASLQPPGSLATADLNEKASQKAKKRLFILSSLLLPSLSKVTAREADSLARLRLVRVAVAVERFRKSNGRFPEKLTDLMPNFLPAIPIDPFDGQPLRYRLLEKGYMIYSVGRDGHDDGGREKPADWKSSDKTTYDITFAVER